MMYNILINREDLRKLIILRMALDEPDLSFFSNTPELPAQVTFIISN